MLEVAEADEARRHAGDHGGGFHFFAAHGRERPVKHRAREVGMPSACMAQRPRGHAGLERLPPHGAVLWRERLGRVLHTVNPRLHPDQIAWIANHAEDQVLCFDMTFLPLVQAVHARCPTVKNWVALCDADKLPPTRASPVW
jgi:hypothetical protein